VEVSGPAGLIGIVDRNSCAGEALTLLMVMEWTRRPSESGALKPSPIQEITRSTAILPHRFFKHKHVCTQMLNHSAQIDPEDGSSMYLRNGGNIAYIRTV
jgi:hypothetical protein